VPEQPSFHALMDRLRAGDDDAAQKVLDHYARRLIALARSRLDRLLCRKIDPEDVLQSVFKSFFARHAGGQVRLDTWDNLWGLLATITVRKCGRHAQYYRAGMRDVRREALPAPGDEAGQAWEAADREPTPAETAVLVETVELLLRGMSERDRQIVELRLQGYRSVEIAAQVGCTERSVQRVLERVRSRLERFQASEAA
jgi:RNA polymerase sigma factor (sigma-70 family)